MLRISQALVITILLQNGARKVSSILLEKREKSASEMILLALVVTMPMNL